MDKHTLIKYLRNKKAELYELYGITSIGIYGSYARDEATE